MKMVIKPDQKKGNKVKGALGKSLKPSPKSSQKKCMQRKVGSKFKKNLKNKPRSKSSTVEEEYKKELKSLKQIDPEFYDFLQKNDKELLDFDVWASDNDDDDIDFEDETEGKGKPKASNSDDSEDEEFDEEEDDEDEVKGKGKLEPSNSDVSEDEEEFDGGEEEEEEDDEKYHKPLEQLEVASDESDFEADPESDEDDFDSSDEEKPRKLGVQKITLAMLKDWQRELERSNVSIEVIRQVFHAFNGALTSIMGDGDSLSSTYKVLGSAVFNGIIQLCVLYLQSAIMRYLGPSSNNKPLQKNKKWPKIRSSLRHYLNDLIHLIEEVSSPNILTVLLKHLHQMAALVAPFSTLGKSILKRLVQLWSSAEDTVRVTAFLCILKITRNQQGAMLNQVLKVMYASYVQNSKFVSPNTLPGINFMRRSLVEMLSLDVATTYQHAFLYIRQLAIHLRNAVILKKKGSYQSVYNWQYINSLRLWGELLCANAASEQLRLLIYPLVTVTIGVIRLIPTAQYFPLRFHCIQILIGLMKATNVYIPVLPLILEVLKSNTFNQKHTAVSMKPMQFTCILRLNKTQLSQNGFRDEVIEQVNGLCLEHLAHESNSLAFCELVVPAVVNLKAYLKNCRNANYSRKLKQLVTKIMDNSKFIEEQRSKMTPKLNEAEKTQGFEAQIRAKGTPLSIYYESWLKTHEVKRRRQAAQSDDINDNYGVPTIKKTGKKSKENDDDEEVELFPTDDEDEEGDEEYDDNDDGSEDNDGNMDDSEEGENSSTDATNERASKGEEEFDFPVEEPDNEEVDIVKDLNLDDW